MTLLNESVRREVREALAAMTEPVRIVLFTQSDDGLAVACDFCRETRQLVEEVVALSDKLSLEVHDFVAEEALARSLGIDKIPALAILRAGAAPRDFGVRIFGIPSGYEFGTFIQDLLLVSQARHDLSPRTLEQLATLDVPVHIQVFVTPTCPYCPRAALLAHRLAIASDQIRADVVEATEFPHLSNRYSVYGVPRTVINEVIHVEGAVPESVLIGELLQVKNPAVMERLRAEWGL